MDEAGEVAAAAAALAGGGRIGQGAYHRSPDSSSPVPTQYQACPQCPTVLANEASLTAHLLTAHRVHLVVSKDAMAAGHVTTTTTTSQFSSAASSLTASPKDNHSHELSA